VTVRFAPGVAPRPRDKTASPPDAIFKVWTFAEPPETWTFCVVTVFETWTFPDKVHVPVTKVWTFARATFAPEA
jgi:hypothetical protein